MQYSSSSGVLDRDTGLFGSLAGWGYINFSRLPLVPSYPVLESYSCLHTGHWMPSSVSIQSDAWVVCKQPSLHRIKVFSPQ